jgi:type II secretory pathway pseudopilin PulG
MGSLAGRPRAAHGFTLVEALVAMAVVFSAVGLLAQLVVAAVRANQEARLMTLAAVIASDKVEQLRGMAGRVELADFPFSPEGSLEQSIEGFVDAFDARGEAVAELQSGAALVRRWSVRPFPSVPTAVVLQVLVLTASSRTRVHLVTVKSQQDG